jgi:AraC-like DNA-binding protein
MAPIDSVIHAVDMPRPQLTAVTRMEGLATQEAFGDLPLDRLLQTLDVRLSAFALLHIGSGYRLNFQGSSAPIIHFVLSGCGYMEFDAGSKFQIEAGDVIILPPGCRKAVRPDEGPSIDVRPGNHCEMVSDGLLQVDAGAERGRKQLTLLCGSVSAGLANAQGLFGRLKKPLAEKCGDTTFMSSAFALLREEAATPGFASRALMGAVMKACLTLVVRRRIDDLMEVHEHALGFSDKRLRRVVLHVAECPGTAHTVASLACLAGMGRTAFATAFKDGFGMSPMAFVSRTRMHYASELLTTTDMPIKRISASIGLSRSHFSRMFNEVFGQYPQALRACSTD